jgi:hypothetical protein
MPVEKREPYSSPTGDRWSLCRDPATGNVFIRHEANLPSGDHLSDIDIGVFSVEANEIPSIKRSCA